MENSRFKFRVWNGSEMVYDVTVGKFGVFYVNPGSKGDGLDENDSASLTPNTTKYHEGTPVMQFTGLKDKNGVEIYGGDVLALEGTDYRYIVTFEDAKFVCYHTRKEIGKWGDLHRFFDPDFSGYKVTVIGNIYQHPSLLK
jgi:uncharacterized phage protein (TIGR01671 family)